MIISYKELTAFVSDLELNILKHILALSVHTLKLLLYFKKKSNSCVIFEVKLAS